MSDDPPSPAVPASGLQVILVTGISGAGRTTALKALEDLGYEAVDNIPLSLLENLLRTGQSRALAVPSERPLAIGVDIRTRDFEADDFLIRYDRSITAHLPHEPFAELFFLFRRYNRAGRITEIGQLFAFGLPDRRLTEQHQYHYENASLLETSVARARFTNGHIYCLTD